MKNLLLVLSIFLIPLTSSAQWEFSLNSSIEMHLDELKWAYKPGLSHIISIAKTDKYKKQRAVLGVNFGLASFTPEKQLFYYLINDDELGTISYDTYHLYILTANYRRDFILSKRFEFFIGSDIGYQLARYHYEAHDSYIDEEGEGIVNRGVISPKLGFTFLLSKHVGVFLQTRYNLSIGKYRFTNSSDIFNYHWSNGGGLLLRFE